jgi:D-3-phosphoglycerate dehydrogenase
LVDDEYLFHFKNPFFHQHLARQNRKGQAVLKAIKEGKILGAGLDVLEVEKFPTLAEQAWFDELTPKRQSYP